MQLFNPFRIFLGLLYLSVYIYIYIYIKKFEWFSFNNLKINVSKCHLFISPYQTVLVNVTDFIIESSSYEKLLGIYLGSNFSFEYHLTL